MPKSSEEEFNNGVTEKTLALVNSAREVLQSTWFKISVQVVKIGVWIYENRESFELLFS